jgi:hypothetical protein
LRETRSFKKLLRIKPGIRFYQRTLPDIIKPTTKGNKMKFYASHDIDSGGTSLQGYITTTQSDLIETFGEPIRFEEGTDKVTLEWIVRFENEEIATIYDWKRYEDGAPGMNEVCEYHIGGNSRDVVSLVKDSVSRVNVVGLS